MTLHYEKPLVARTTQVSNKCPSIKIYWAIEGWLFKLDFRIFEVGQVRIKERRVLVKAHKQNSNRWHILLIRLVVGCNV